MANEIIINNNKSENTYNTIRHSIITAQQKVYAAVNSAMVFAYWEIGEQIYKACSDNDRSEYGKNLIKYEASVVLCFAVSFVVHILNPAIVLFAPIRLYKSVHVLKLPLLFT